MRLFVAIDISDETRAQLRRVRTSLERQLALARTPPRVTWVRDEAAHVTLRFIGEVADAIAGRVQEALSRPFEQRAFDVEFKNVGTFPHSRRPRVVWIDTTIGGDEIAVLADAVNGRLESIVGPAEARPFRAHLTVGRVKEPGKGFNWERALATVRARRTHSRIEHVTLYLSRVSSKGPTYTALCTTPLR